MEGLGDGGVDLLLVETIFDTLNAKAAIFAAEQVFEARGAALPVFLSVTVTDKSGRTLAGQTLDAFWISVAHARPLAVGINCALGPDEMRPHLAELAKVVPTFVFAYPNAGLPNAFGGYDETAEQLAPKLGEGAGSGGLDPGGGGGRCGSLVKAGDFQAAVEVALDQVRSGANVLDVNMDEAMLDSAAAMTTFLNLIATEPEIAIRFRK